MPICHLNICLSAHAPRSSIPLQLRGLHNDQLDVPKLFSTLTHSSRHEVNTKTTAPYLGLEFPWDCHLLFTNLSFQARRSRLRRSTRQLRFLHIRSRFLTPPYPAIILTNLCYWSRSYCSSYGALVIRGGLKKGETVLVHAAAGPLGLMAVQIAKAVGCTVIATAGSKEKLDVARRFGADEWVNYVEDADEWWKRVLELTNGEGVDVVYDPIGLVVSINLNPRPWRLFRCLESSRLKNRGSED